MKGSRAIPVDARLSHPKQGSVISYRTDTWVPQNLGTARSTERSNLLDRGGPQTDTRRATSAVPRSLFLYGTSAGGLRYFTDCSSRCADSAIAWHACNDDPAARSPRMRWGPVRVDDCDAFERPSRLSRKWSPRHCKDGRSGSSDITNDIKAHLKARELHEQTPSPVFRDYP